MEVISSSIKLHCAQKAETLLNLGENDMTRARTCKNFFLSKEQALFYNSVLLESVCSFHTKEKLKVKISISECLLAGVVPGSWWLWSCKSIPSF